MRFHTPRNVPGKSMNSSPTTIYAISARCRRASRSAQAATGSPVAVTMGKVDMPSPCDREEAAFQFHSLWE